MHPRLHIHHNHGTLVLGNAFVNLEGVATGIVVSGHTTNRLLWASHTTYETAGVERSYPLYGRQIRPQFYTGPYDQPSPTPGEFHVDVCFCG